MTQEQREAELEFLEKPLKEAKNQLEALEERLEKLEDKIESQEDLVSTLEQTSGRKMRMLRALGTQISAFHKPVGHKDEP